MDCRRCAACHAQEGRKFARGISQCMKALFGTISRSFTRDQSSPSDLSCQRGLTLRISRLQNSHTHRTGYQK